jgi:hypothetical protein
MKKWKVHLVLQAKGGIGKSYVSSLLAQLLQRIFDNPKFIDLDQENPTFSQYGALGASRLSVMDDNHSIDPMMFDKLMEMIITHEGDVVVDTGANTFSAFLAYAIQNLSFDMIKENGKELIIHTIIGGGDVMYDTANGFADIANYVDGGIVLWLNEHFGALESNTGVKIENAKVYKENAHKLIGTVTLKKRSIDFDKTINKMTSLRLTFDEVENSDKFDFAEKNRLLKIVRNDVFGQLNSIIESLDAVAA